MRLQHLADVSRLQEEHKLLHSRLQVERVIWVTQQERETLMAEFDLMLKALPDLYLTSRVLILLDSTYNSRFWCADGIG